MVGCFSVPVSYLPRYMNINTIRKRAFHWLRASRLVPVQGNQTVGRQADLQPVIIRKSAALVAIPTNNITDAENGSGGYMGRPSIHWRRYQNLFVLSTAGH